MMFGMFGALWGLMHTCIGCILPFVIVKKKKTKKNKNFSGPTDPCPESNNWTIKQFFIFGLTNKYTELQAPRENLYIEKKLNNGKK